MRIKRPVKKLEITAFLELLCSLLKSGLALNHCLESLNENPSCRKYASKIKMGLENSESAGHAIISVCRKLTMYESMLLSAEKTGDIVPVLENITEEMKEEKERKYDTVIICLYPAVIILIAFTLSFLLLIFALPYIQLVSYVDRLTFIKGIILANIWLAVSVTLTAFFIIYCSGKSDFQYRLFRTLYYLSLNRVSLDDSFSLVLRENAANRKGSKIVGGILSGIRNGKKLSVLCQEGGYFDSFCNAWLCTAEENGEMTGSFKKIFLHYKYERKKQKETVKRFIEPVIMFDTGVYILTLVTVCIVPVFQNLGSTLL